MTIQEAFKKWKELDEAYTKVGYATESAKEDLREELQKKYKAGRIEIGSWECQGSPIDVCIYDDEDDHCWDFCLVCGNPNERK